VEPVIERFEPVNLLAHRLRDRAGSLADHDVDVGREEAEHALLPEATAKRTDRIRMGVGFLRALLSRPIGEQHQRANDLVAPLGLIDEAQLQLCKLRGRFHVPFCPVRVSIR
jgi:hypothetical protein